MTHMDLHETQYERKEMEHSKEQENEMLKTTSTTNTKERTDMEQQLIPAQAGWRAALLMLDNIDGVYHGDFENQSIHEAIDEEMNSGAYSITTTPIIAWGPHHNAKESLVGYVRIPEWPQAIEPVCYVRANTEGTDTEYWFVGYLAASESVEVLENEAYGLYQLWRDETELWQAGYMESEDGFHFVSPLTGEVLSISEALREAGLTGGR